MKYFAKKPCKFAGKSYLIGDVIPVEVLIPSRIEALKSAGIIYELSETGEKLQEQTGIVEFELPILNIGLNGGIENMKFNNEELKDVFMYLQMTASQATESIERLPKPEEAKNVLIAVKVLDGRKTVKDAAKKKLEEIYASKNVTDGDNEPAKGDA